MITPFYIGQKVVALSDGAIRRKGKVYPVTGFYAGCKCGTKIYLDNIPGRYLSGKPYIPGSYVTCDRCGVICKTPDFQEFCPKNFAPVQETGLPLISLSKIREKERVKEFEPANFEPQILAEN